MKPPTKQEKVKGVTLVLFLLALYYVGLLYLLSRFNTWLKATSIFGITFMGVDLRVYFVGFIFAIFGIWLLLEIDDYLQFKKWRRSWK